MRRHSFEKRTKKQKSIKLSQSDNYIRSFEGVGLKISILILGLVLFLIGIGLALFVLGIPATVIQTNINLRDGTTTTSTTSTIPPAGSLLLVVALCGGVGMAVYGARLVVGQIRQANL